MKKKKAVVLLSGGLDSATCLYIALSRGYSPLCLTFEYGQKHYRELLCAGRLASSAAAPLAVVKTSFPWNKSALISGGAPVGNYRKNRRAAPPTYVPGRNTIFIAHALAYAETAAAEKIFIGANAVDFSGYPDCRPRYFAAWNSLLKTLGTHIKIETPLLHLKKSEIVRLGLRLKVPYENTWSCYRGGRRPCQKCDSCALRAKGFAEALARDPLTK